MDLKRNTVSQSKFPTSTMSPALQHTPAQGASSNQISDTEMELYIRTEIDKYKSRPIVHCDCRILGKDKY